MNKIILRNLLYYLQYKDYTTLILYYRGSYLLQCSVTTILYNLNSMYLDCEVISYCISDYCLEVWCD